MPEKSFAVYRNLAFYPYKTKINFADHFVYFDLLLSYKMSEDNENHKKYNRYSEQLGNAASSALSAGFLGSKSKDVDKQINNFRNVLQIMQKGVELEQRAELNFISARMQDLITSFGDQEIPEEVIKIKKILQDINANNEIDYPGLIILLNSLLKGISNTKALFSYEEQRLNNWQQQLQNYEASHNRQLEGLSKIMDMDYTRSTRDTVRQYRYYLEHHSMGDINGVYDGYKNMKQYLQRVEATSDIKIANWLNNNLNNVLTNKEIFNSVINILQDHIIQALNDGNYKNSGEIIKSGIIKIFLKYATDNIDKILSNELGQLNKTQIEEICISAIKNPTYSFKIPIDGLYNNFGYYRNDIKLFDENGNPTGSFANAYATLNKIKQAVKKNRKNPKLHDQVLFLNRLRSKGGKTYTEINNAMELINDLEKQIKEISNAFSRGIKNGEKQKIKVNGTELEVILDENGKLQFADLSLAKETLGDINLSTNLKSMIANWKKQVGRQIRDLLIQINTGKNKKIMKNMAIKTQKALENIRININGPDLSEVIGAINFTNQNGTVQISWNGKDMKKNDITVVVEPPNMGEIKTNFSEEVLSELGRQPDEILQQGLQKFYNDVREKEQEAVNQTHRKVNYKADAKAFFQASENFTKLLQESFKISEDLNSFLSATDEENATKREAIKAILQKFQESFYISDTTKTFNTYRNDIGFVGGTLASSGLIHQLDNLNEIFEAAGAKIAKKDMDWLITAILNSGDLMLGKNNRNLIETYLGSLAVFALFNEGGAEVAIINKLINDTQSHITETTPQIMHLYHLNGAYYPGSFVLAQALESVSAVITELENAQSVTNHNSNIRILNPIGPNILPNRKGSEPSDTAPWQTISKTALSSVSINIVFLAGLIDILNNINEKIQEIQL